MNDNLWFEIQDAPGEIFDLPEMREFSDEIDPEEDILGYDDLTNGLTLDYNYDF